MAKVTAFFLLLFVFYMIRVDPAGTGEGTRAFAGFIGDMAEQLGVFLSEVFDDPATPSTPITPSTVVQ